MGTVIESAEDIDELLWRTGDSVGLLLDTGHLTYAGGDVEAVAERHSKRIVHVHCKDVRMLELAEAQARDISFLDAVLAGVFTVPGDGMIDYHSLIDILNDARYHGWLVVEAEQDPRKAHPLTYATMGFHHLRDVLSAEFATSVPSERRPAYLTK
jgi:inosose dehydratase